VVIGGAHSAILADRADCWGGGGIWGKERNQGSDSERRGKRTDKKRHRLVGKKLQGRWAL